MRQSGQIATDPSAVVLIPREMALKGVCVAIGRDDQVLTVAMSDPLVFSLVHDLETRTGYRLKQVISTPAEILKAIEAAYPDNANSPEAHADAEAPATARATVERADAGSAPSVEEIVDLVIRSLTGNKASAVHIDPMDGRVLVRQRIDGTLIDLIDLPGAIHDRLVARFKTMAGMDVTEQRLSQEGRLRAANDGRDVDLRVSTLRTLHGERVVLGVLGQGSGAPPLSEIGMSATALSQLRRLLRRPQGLILVVGPAGSGRSTTLASVLASMVTERGEIVTIEDPVAYQIAGVNQTRITDAVGVTFASAIQSVLLQDPDVILISEICDRETALAALQASNAGHLILSALQAEDAPSAVARLIEIGMEPSVLAGALVGVVAQRLVRRLCQHCRRRFTPSPGMLRTLGMSGADGASIVFYEAVGCDQCNHTGYRGRIGIYEVMGVTDAVRRLITAGGTEDDIRQTAFSDGMISLGEDGLAKMKAGITTPEELFRAVAEIRETRALCAACGTAVGVDFTACPACGTRLGGCPHCGRVLQPGWNFCPYCARSVIDSPPSPRRGDPGRPGDDETRRGRRDLPPGKIAEFKK